MSSEHEVVVEEIVETMEEPEKELSRTEQNVRDVQEAMDKLGMIYEHTSNAHLIQTGDGSWVLRPDDDELVPQLPWSARRLLLEELPTVIARANIGHIYLHQRVSINSIPEILDERTGKPVRYGGTIATSLTTGARLQFVEVRGGFKCWLAPIQPCMLEDFFGHSKKAVDVAMMALSTCVLKKERRGDNLSNRDLLEPWINCGLHMDPDLPFILNHVGCQRLMWLRFSYTHSQGYLCTTLLDQDSFLEFIHFSMRYL